MSPNCLEKDMQLSTTTVSDIASEENLKKPKELCKTQVQLIGEIYTVTVFEGYGQGRVDCSKKTLSVSSENIPETLMHELLEWATLVAYQRYSGLEDGQELQFIFNHTGLCIIAQLVGLHFLRILEAIGTELELDENYCVVQQPRCKKKTTIVVEEELPNGSSTDGTT